MSISFTGKTKSLDKEILEQSKDSDEILKEVAISIKKLTDHDNAYEEVIKHADNRTYEYDEDDNLITVRYWEGETLLTTQSFQYDEEGNLTGEVWEFG